MTEDAVSRFRAELGAGLTANEDRLWRSPPQLKAALRGNDTRRRRKGDIGRKGTSPAR
jgi:hypothetical protein